MADLAAAAASRDGREWPSSHTARAPLLLRVWCWADPTLVGVAMVDHFIVVAPPPLSITFALGSCCVATHTRASLSLSLFASSLL
jgi:hypothetical protein